MLAGAALYTLVVLMLLEWLVEPRLFRRKRYNPILLVLVAVAMVDWLGFFGLLIAPPVAAAVQILGSQFLAYRAISTTVAVDVSPRALAQQLATLRAGWRMPKGCPRRRKRSWRGSMHSSSRRGRSSDPRSSVPAGTAAAG